jgi:hypothetical protein
VWNLLENFVTSVRRRQGDFEIIVLSLEDVFCNDTGGLYGVLGHVHNPEEWRLFIGNDDIYPSVPLAYSVHMKESHKEVRTLLNYIDYETIRGRYGEIWSYWYCYWGWLH